MNKKAAKAANPPVNDDLERQRLTLEREKFEHQKAIDGQRLAYETKKAPPNLTKWQTIAAMVLIPLVSAIVTILCAQLVFDSKVMELKNQEALKMRDLQYGMTTQIMSNWKALNSMSSGDKRNMATLIKGFFPEQEAVQIFAMLERNSPPAAKAIWHEAKANVLVQQSAVEAPLEKPDAPSQEAKAPETFRSVNATHSPSSPWATESLAALLLNNTNKPNGGDLSAVSGWPTTNAAPNNDLVRSWGFATPVGFKETAVPKTYAFPAKESPSPTSVGFQITTGSDVIGGSQVTVTIGGTSLRVVDGKMDLLTSKPVLGVDSAWGILSRKEVPTDANNGVTLGELGSPRTGAPNIIIGASGHSSILNALPGSLSPNGANIIKLEYAGQPMIEVVKPRVQ